MGRGIISGMVLGAVFSAAVLAAASLVLPLPVVSQPEEVRPMPPALVAPVEDAHASPDIDTGTPNAAPTVVGVPGADAPAQPEVPPAEVAPAATGSGTPEASATAVDAPGARAVAQDLLPPDEPALPAVIVSDAPVVADVSGAGAIVQDVAPAVEPPPPPVITSVAPTAVPMIIGEPGSDAAVQDILPSAAAPSAMPANATDAPDLAPLAANLPGMDAVSQPDQPAADAVPTAPEIATNAPEVELMATDVPGTDAVLQLDLHPTEPEAAPVAAIHPGIVEVPAGSEFARGAGDLAPRLPATEAAPQAGSAPVAPAFAADAPPALASTAPAARPVADAGPTAPATPLAGMLAPLPEGEQPLPVPPAGEALAPELPTVATVAPDRPATPGVPSQETVVPEPPVDAPPAAPEAVAPQTSAMPQPAEQPSAGNGAASASVSDLSDQPEIILLPETAPAPPDTSAPIEPGFGNAPQPGFGIASGRGFANVPGVVVDRLPSIGAPEAGETVSSEAVPAPVSALERFRQPFTPTGAPLLSIILLDPGPEAGGLGRAALKTLNLPLTIALDPMRPDATEASADFRAAGFEVAILAAPLPAGATPVDLEVALSAWRKVIPEAVAVIEPPAPVVQANHSLSQQLVAALARDGLGLVTQSDKGLNAAAQVAALAALPQASVWRVLDAGRDKTPAVVRYLDRARFEAARGAGVAVMVHGWPDTVQALRDWVRTKDASTDLAPISALILAGSGAVAP